MSDYEFSFVACEECRNIFWPSDVFDGLCADCETDLADG